MARNKAPLLTRRPSLGLLLAALLPGAISAQSDTAVTTKPDPVRSTNDLRHRVTETPQYREFADGVYARIVYRTESDTGDYIISVWGLLIAPDHSAAIELPGTAVLTMRSQHATYVGSESKRELGLGTTWTVPFGERFDIVNPDPERPVAIRAIVFSASE